MARISLLGIRPFAFIAVERSLESQRSAVGLLLAGRLIDSAAVVMLLGTKEVSEPAYFENDLVPTPRLSMPRLWPKDRDERFCTE
jgi:hypothetical protein